MVKLNKRHEYYCIVTSVSIFFYTLTKASEFCTPILLLYRNVSNGHSTSKLVFSGVTVMLKNQAMPWSGDP